MVSSFLQIAGWEVIDLGVDVPAGIFVDKAIEHGSLVIGASAMMYSTAKNIKKLKFELENRGLSGKIQLAVGGAVFRLKGTGTRNRRRRDMRHFALQAPALFERLWNSAVLLNKGKS